MAVHRLARVALGAAILDLALLHLLPPPLLHATTGAAIPYRPWNFLSELARSDYAPLMTACFFLLAFATFATGVALRRILTREAPLLALAGVALALLGCFPTDLVDFRTDAVTCGLPGRIEPCTLVGRLHNPLSNLVFVPIALVIMLVCLRGRTDPQWRGLGRLAAVCGLLALGGVLGATLYQHAIGWHGRWWTGLMQRSLVFPALLWMTGLLGSTGRHPAGLIARRSRCNHSARGVSL